jgi:hypothetical protein
MSRSLSPLFALALLFALAPSLVHAPPAGAAPAKCLPGQYDASAPEIAAGLELSANGRFRYGLSYGALDERAQGRWEADDRTVFLTSDPVTPSRFVLIDESSAPEGSFRLSLDLPEGISPQYFNALLVLKDGRTIGAPLGYEDWVVPLAAGEEAVSVKLQLPVLDIESERFVLSHGQGTAVSLRFEPNDLGAVAFAEDPLAIDGRDLTLERHGRALRFRPENGGC